MYGHYDLYKCILCFSGGIWMSLVRLAEMVQFYCPRSQWFLTILGRFPDEFVFGGYIFVGLSHSPSVWYTNL